MQYAVIGLGTFGKKIALTLTDKGAKVVAIDKNKDRVEEIKDNVAVALILDSTNEEAMKAAQIQDVDAAVVALGDAQEQSILTTTLLKKIGISPIIARAANKLYADVLKMVGADRVIIIEEQVGEDVAKKLMAPTILDKVMLSTGHNLVEIEAKKEFIGKTLGNLNLRKEFGVNVIAIQKKVSKIDDDGKVYQAVVVNDLPSPDNKIEEGDILIVVGTEADIERLAVLKKKD